MKRRDFIQNSSLLAFSISAFGFTKWNGEKYVGDTPTTSDILGPFYRPNAPMRSDIVPTGSNGSALSLKGVVYKEDGKTPLKNALVEIWQCDENEYYDNTSDDYLFRGAVKTGNGGTYDFKTIVPVPYKADPDDETSWRPAHIHMRVSSGAQQDLVTQLYIQGDKYNATDSSAAHPESATRVLEITKNKANENVLNFDVVLGKNLPLSDEAYKKIAGLYQTERSKYEYIQSDDLLLLKRNGQISASLNYIGNNTFEGAFGRPKVKFEFLASGEVQSTTSYPGRSTFVGTKFLKYF